MLCKSRCFGAGRLFLGGGVECIAQTALSRCLFLGGGVECIVGTAPRLALAPLFLGEGRGMYCVNKTAKPGKGWQSRGFAGNRKSDIVRLLENLDLR